LKGSYYANPVVDCPQVSAALKAEYPEVYGNNIWPSASESGIEGFEEAFKALGRFIYHVGCEIALACQPFVSSHLKDAAISLPTLLSQSQTLKARLLHYFPPSSHNLDILDGEDVETWCGLHKDHSMLTGLSSAMYLTYVSDVEPPTISQAPNPTAGLYIYRRGGDLRKVTIPTGCLAFQTGEALEVATEGRLRATPHCVRVGKGGHTTKAVSREAFVLFMAPDTEQPLSASETYGQFSKRIIKSHYEAADVHSVK